MNKIGSAGDCPRCGDELLIMRSRAGGRFVKCANIDCDLSYPVPKHGSLEYSYEQCPQNQLPIIIVTKKNSNVQYFWVDSPCFTCRYGSSCKPLKELRVEYEMNQAPQHA